MKTRRQRELQAAEGVPVTPPQALEATHRTRRGTSRTTSRAPTTEPSQSQSHSTLIDLTVSEPSEQGDAQSESTQPPPRSRAPTTRARGRGGTGRAQSKATSRATGRATGRATSRATSRATTAEPAQLGSSRAEAIQIGSSESDPSDSDRSEPEATEAEHNEPEPTPSEPDQPVFIKTELVDDGSAQPESIQSEPTPLEPPHLEPPQSEVPQPEPPLEPPQTGPPQIESPQIEPKVEAPQLQSPQAGPSQAGTSLTPNIDAAVRRQVEEWEVNRRKRRYEDTMLYDLRTRNEMANQKRQRAGKPKVRMAEVSAKYHALKKRQAEERKAKSAETSTPEETTQTDDPGPSEDDGSTARTSPEIAPVDAATVKGSRDTNKKDDELAQRVSPSKKSPISSATPQDPLESAQEAWRAQNVRADDIARARLRLQSAKAAAHPVHAPQTAAGQGGPSRAPQQVTSDPLPPSEKVTYGDWIQRGAERLRQVPPEARTPTQTADLKYFDEVQARREGPEWRPTAPSAIIAQPYEGEITSAHVDFVEPTSRQNFQEQLRLRMQQEAEARAARAQAPRPPSLEDPALAIHNWPQASGATRHTLVKFCVSPRLAAECDPSYHLDKHPLSLAVDDDVFLDIMHVLANHSRSRHGVLYDLRNIHPRIKASSERMINYGDPDSSPADSISSKTFPAEPTRGTRTTSQPDRPRNLRTTSRAGKPPGSKKRQALAEVDAQSHIEDGGSSQAKPNRRTVRMPKYFTGPMDNRTVLRDYSQQDVPLIESDNLSSDDESMLDLNEHDGNDVVMGDQSVQQGQVDQHIQSAGAPTTPTTQATSADAAATTKSGGWVFGSLLPSAARTVSKFLPTWRQQPSSLTPSPTQQPVAAPATGPRQRQHASATQGQGRIERRKAITHSTIARQPNGAVRLMTKGAIGAMKQRAENRKTLEWRAKRAEEEKEKEVARKEREKQDITNMKDNVIASLQKQLYDAKRGVISDNPANWRRPREPVPSHAQEEALASKDSVIRSLRRQLQEVQGVSHENARRLREAESNQGQALDLTRPTSFEEQKRKRAPSPDIIPNPVANGFGLDLDYFGFDDDDSRYLDGEEDDHELTPATSKRLRTLESSATDKAVASLNDAATESSNLDMTPRPGPPIGDRFRATPYTGRIFSNTSTPSAQEALDNLFSEEAIPKEPAEQQVTTSNKPLASQPNTFTVPSEQPANQDEPQVSQPNTFTVPSPQVTFQDNPQVTKPNPFFTMSSPSVITAQDKTQASKPLFFNPHPAQAPTQQQPQVSQPPLFNMLSAQAPAQQQPQVSQPPLFNMPSAQAPTQQQPQVSPSLFFNLPSAQAPTQQQPQASQPNTFTMPLEQATVQEQPQVNKANPFFNMSSPSVTTQEQPQVTKPNPFFSMSSSSSPSQPPVSQPNTFNVPAEQVTVQEKPQVTKPNPFFSMSWPSSSPQPPMSQPNTFNVPSEEATVQQQATVQEQPQVTKPSLFFNMASPSNTTQDKPQVSQPNTFNVPAEPAIVQQQATVQEQPQVTKPNLFFNMASPSVTTQDKPQVSKPNVFSNIASPSVLSQEQPQAIKPFFSNLPSPSVMTQEQPQVIKPFFSNLPSPSSPPQPPMNQPNTSIVHAEQATVQEKPQVTKPNSLFNMASPSVATQDKPQVSKPNLFNMASPSVLTQDKPQVIKPFFSNLPSPSVMTQEQPQVVKPFFSNLPSPSFAAQPKVSQPNTFTVPSPGANDSDFSFAEPPTTSSPKASSPLKASQATPTPAQTQQAAEAPELSFAEPPTPSKPKGLTPWTLKASSPFKGGQATHAPAEKQPAPAEKQPAPAEKQTAPATPLPPTLSNISLARQREQALKYAAKTPSRLHEATRPSSTNVESEGSDNQPAKSLATLAPAPVSAPAPPQATAPYPSIRQASNPEGRKDPETMLKDLGLTDYENLMNSDQATQEFRDAFNKMRQQNRKAVNEAVKVEWISIDNHMIWQQRKSNATSHVSQAPKPPQKRPLTRRGPPAAVRTVPDTSRPVEQRQTTEDAIADINAFLGIKPAAKPFKPPPPRSIISHDNTHMHARPPPQEKFNFMETYNGLLAYYKDEDTKKMAKKGP